MSAGFDTPGLATAGRLYLFVFVLSVKSVVNFILTYGSRLLFLVEFLGKLARRGKGAEGPLSCCRLVRISSSLGRTKTGL